MKSIYGKRKNYRMPQYLPSEEERAAYNYCIRNNIILYHYKAINLSGDGSSKECRKYISEMLSISAIS